MINGLPVAAAVASALFRGAGVRTSVLRVVVLPIEAVALGLASLSRGPPFFF